jgi:16S rRNA (cytosine967-C5)-methyltransferase
MKLEPDARTIAAYVLERVAREQAFAAAVLHAAIARYPELDPRERALATELTYGALRTGPYIEAELARHAPRGLGKLDAAVRAHLLVAGYQILFLDKVPAFAAVSEAVNRIRRARGRQLAAFCNAILRRLSEQEGARIPPAEAMRRSIAPWLREGLERALGAAEAEAFLAGPVPPPLGLRVRLGSDRDASIAKLRAEVPRASFEPGRVSPLAILARGTSDPHLLPGYEEGRLLIQEEGAQLLALALGAREGETVLDACAGRGNKTALLAEAVGAGGAVDAADLHPQKLEQLETELARTKLAARHTFAVDWSVGTGAVPANYDRVLVDAPCTGVGTVRRRPELATRRGAADLAELAALQVRILVAAASRVRPGGRVVYAVCSVLREEAEDVVARVLEDAAAKRAPALREAAFPSGPAAEIAAGRSSFRLLPHLHGTDGYFVASFTRD